MNTLTICLLAGLMAAGPAGATAADKAAIPLRFGDFFVQPAGPRGLQPTAALQAADGRRVRLVGWMVGREQPAAGYFLLTPRPVQLSEHADGDADDLPPATVLVRLPAERAAQALPHQAGLIELEGTLSLGRAVEADGRVSWVQLQLQRPLP